MERRNSAYNLAAEGMKQIEGTKPYRLLEEATLFDTFRDNLRNQLKNIGFPSETRHLPGLDVVL